MLWMRVMGLLVAATLAGAAARPAYAEPQPADGCNRAAFRVIIDVGHTEKAPGAISARQRIEALRPPRPLRQDRRGEAEFLLRVHLAAVAHLGATDLDRPNPSLDRAMRPVAVTHDAVAAIR